MGPEQAGAEPGRARLLLLSALAFALTACASLPGVPAGPIGKPGGRIGFTYAYAYAPAQAQGVDGSREPYRMRGNSQMYGGIIPLFPLRAMGRLTPAPFVDLGADVGWIDGGLQLRAGPLDAQARLPWGFEIEWRTGKLALFEDSFVRRTNAYRARTELYPRLGRWGELDTFGVLSLGASTGLRLHTTGVPGELDTNTSGEGDFSPPTLYVLRPETRIEMSLGAHGRSSKRALTIALLPWLVVDERRVRAAECSSCVLSYQSFDVDFGLALAVTASALWEMD